MKPLDLTKPLQTKDGHPVRVLGELKGEALYPLVVAIDWDDHESVDYYSKDGKYRVADDDANDLINVSKKHVREVWANLYQKRSGDLFEHFYLSKVDSDNNASYYRAHWGHKRIACKKVTVEFEEGEGL